VLATVVPALGTTVLSYGQNRRALTDQLDSELRSIVSQSAREIDLWVDERSYEVRVFTGSFEVTENIARVLEGGPAGAEAQSRLSDYLVSVYGLTSDYAGLMATDAAANTMASTGEVEVSLDALPTDWLDRVQRGEAVISQLYAVPGASQTVATLAVPIEAGPLSFLGTLAAALRFDAVGDILEGFAPDGAGRVALVTSTGEVIARSTPTVETSLPVDAVGSDVFERLSGADGGAVEYTTGDGIEMVGAMAPVPGLEWSVVAQIPADDAYAEIVQLRTSAFLLVSLILVFVGGIAYLLGVVIVRPLARLTEGAGAVAAGDLSVDLPEAGRGEIGSLTRVFNDMVGQLRRSREELDERNRELEQLSLTDLLTGLKNRRFLLEAFDKEIRRADRHERPFCVLMIDVDRFKDYNDTHGHLAGDEVLKRMGVVLTDATRDLDVVARYGGEEFICLLPECTVENAVAAAERIRARLAKERFEGGLVTISVGAAEFPTHGDSASSVIAEADAALYEAKAAGRDQVKGAPPKPKQAAVEAASNRTASAKKRRGTAKKPATKKPATKKPATKKPTAKKSTAKKPAAKEPDG
jgi:diguanylate cyclase (GGDEF)-like protein